MTLNRKYTTFVIALSLTLVGFLSSCLRDDIPYPRIQPNIVELTVENQAQATQLDTINRVATVYLTEAADIYSVNIESCRISSGASFVGDSIHGSLDLSSPQYFTLRIYQEYTWTVKAQQTIERYFSVQNQIGSSVIDVPGRRIIVTLPETVDLSNVKVLTAKLGSVNAVMTPNVVGEYVDLTKPLSITVSDYGREAPWTVYAVTTTSTVSTLRVDAWTNVAWVYGEGQEGRNNTVQYRRADELQWTTVPDEWLTVDGGSFHARLIHLESLTQYVARAISDDECGQEIEFTTGANVQLPNSDFENWWLDGKIWCPWAEDGEPYWGTGNKGAATLGSSNSVPTDDTPSGSGLAAKLETKFVGIAAIGKLAAGNIFLGSYVRTVGTNGVLSFGREFTERPTKVRGYYKYTTAPISNTTTGFEDWKGRPDTCSIWCALIDTSAPFEIRTDPTDRQLFDPDGDYVVAYGKMWVGYDVPNYTRFEVEFEYKATNRKPTYLLLAASASKYGDYFTGGNGAVLYVDDFELYYDY
jgi:hypothetical protein